jgi:hypothetical protein
MSDTEDLGLPDKTHLPNCASCRKQSDAAQKVGTTVLCGRCYDLWLASPERAICHSLEDRVIEVTNFARRMRETRFQACWDAEPLRKGFSE